MSKSLEKIEKDSASDESSDSKTAKSDGPICSQTKERRKSVKKKLLRSGNRRPRMSGGADEAGASESPQRVSIKEETDSQNGDAENLAGGVPDTPPSSPSACSQTLVKTGDAKADEMLETALKNLEEAGKALAALGVNVEHELKLFLVDLMGRTRKWASTVESKMEWTRRDIIELSKELASRLHALEQSRRESAELRDQLAHSEELALMRSADPHNMKPGGSIHGGIPGVVGPGGVTPGGTIMGGMGAMGSMGGMGGMGAMGVMDPCADPCAEPISPCDMPSHVREGESDINAYKAEQERLMACCSELEAEICSLKKENERIVKERAEYENAIQRALLKGVSSLNVEALKVLRCTPIPSCCPPCQPSSSIEPVNNKSRDCTSPRSQRDPCGTQRDPCGSQRDPCGSQKDPCGSQRDPCGGNNRHGASKSCTSSREALNSRGNGGRICPGSTGHSERKSRKSKDNNMLLLLHQKDAESFGIQGGCDSAPRKSNDCGKHKKSHYQC